MTDREKQIEEMAQVLETAKIKALATIGSLNNGFGEWYAKALHNADYRKADEVRKETAEKFVKFIEDYECIVPWPDLDEFCKQFGVEV